MPKRPEPPNLELLLPSWLLSLRADRKSEQTLKGYSDGVRFYLRWCERVHADPLDRGSLRGWVTELMDGGNRPATARARQLGCCYDARAGRVCSTLEVQESLGRTRGCGALPRSTFGRHCA